jgi:hypothetical protein
MQTNNAQLTTIIRGLQARLATPDLATLQQAISMWELLARKFGTLIGQSGIKLILGRSIDRVRPQFPWLPSAKGTLLIHLQEAFDQQSPAEAIAANSALLEAFIHLLATLIGAGLTLQFLRTALADDSATSNQPEN